MAADEPLADRLRELEVLYESVGALTATLDLGELVRRLLDRIRTLSGAGALSLLLHDPARGELVFVASAALSEDALLQPGLLDGERLRLGQGIAGWVALHREPVCLADASTDPRHDPTIARRTGIVARAMVCVPLVHRDDLLGVLQVMNPRGGAPFPPATVRLVRALAGHAAVAIAHAQLYRRVEQASLTDDLTGLGNTRRFDAGLPALLAAGGPVSLLLLDLDGLKAVVDREGHLVGSRTIATVGRLIAERLRPGDLGARFGGDEFVVVLPDTDTPAARAWAEDLRAAIAACPAPDGTDADIRRVTASLGVATFPVHATTAEDLFRAADRAMYAVKFRTKNGVAVAPGPGSG